MKNLPNASDIVDMATYRREERMAACGGTDPVLIQVAYAADDLSLNHFGKLYCDDAPLCLHRSMADVVVDAAIDLHTRQGWRLKLLDGLRTVDAQIAMEQSEHTDPAHYTNHMLSAAGNGAHPKGMAIDLMAVGSDGREIDVGTPFDDLDPERSARNYSGDAITVEAKQNRITVEAAMLRSAFRQGRLLAPLRNEHWDYRFPENLGDGWRVLESVCRVSGLPFDKSLKNRQIKNYADFKRSWQEIFQGKEQILEKTIGVSTPPATESSVIYHGTFRPMTDSDLSSHHRQCLTSRYAERAREISLQR